MGDWTPLVIERLRAEGESPTLHRDAIDEVAAHLEDVYRSAVANGHSEAEAARLARQELDGLGPLAIAVRQRANRRWQRAPTARRWLRGAGTDVRLAVRGMIRRPATTALSAVTLALGIGVSATVFGIYDGVLLRSLPYPDPSELVLLWEGDAANPGNTHVVAGPVYEDWRAHNRTLSSLGAWEFKTFNVSTPTDPQQVPGIRVTSSLFATLGVGPAIGRVFTEDEDRQGSKVALLSDAMWRTHYGAAPDITGRSIRLDGEPHEVIGVMAPAFTFPTHATGVYVPMTFTAKDSARDAHSFFVAGRLRDGTTFEEAADDVARIGRDLAAAYPENAGDASRLTLMADLGMAPVRRMLVALSSAAALVLLIACVNVANLQIASALDRRREFVVQQALGAGTSRLARQLFAGGLVLAALGAAGGVVVAWLGTQTLDALLGPDFLNFWFRGRVQVKLDVFLLGAALAAAAMAALLFSFAPLVALRRRAPATSLADGGRGASAAALGVRRVLVAAEVALTVVVLCGAGLLVRSLAALLDVDPGLRPDRVLTVQVSLPQEDTYGPAARPLFCEDIAQGASSGPFEAISAISHLPFGMSNASRALTVEGRVHNPDDSVSASYRLICPGYFRTLGIPILAGRDVTATDSEPVVVINQAMADRYFKDEQAVGQRIRIGRNNQAAWMRIVGVAGNVRHFGLDAAPEREIYVPYRQNAWPTMTVVAKAALDAGRGPSDALVKIIRAAYPGLPTTTVRRMDDVIAATTDWRASFMRLLLVFAAIGLVLAAVGVYSVLAYIVTRRTREFGIRMALGAAPGAVVRLALQQSLAPLGVGLIAGSIASIWTGRLLVDELFNTSPGDLSVASTVTLIVLVVGLVASWLPARRAAQVAPTAALREE